MREESASRSVSCSILKSAFNLKFDTIWKRTARGAMQVRKYLEVALVNEMHLHAPDFFFVLSTLINDIIISWERRDFTVNEMSVISLSLVRALSRHTSKYGDYTL